MPRTCRSRRAGRGAGSRSRARCCVPRRGTGRWDLILVSLQSKHENKPPPPPRAPQSAPQPPQFMRDAYPSPPAAFRAPGRISALPSPRTRPAAAGGSHHSRPPHMPDSTQHSQSPRITLGTAPAARAGGLGPGGWAAASRAWGMVKSLSINHSFCPTAPAATPSVMQRSFASRSCRSRRRGSKTQIYGQGFGS